MARRYDYKKKALLDDLQKEKSFPGTGRVIGMEKVESDSLALLTSQENRTKELPRRALPIDQALSMLQRPPGEEKLPSRRKLRDTQ